MTAAVLEIGRRLSRSRSGSRSGSWSWSRKFNVDVAVKIRPAEERFAKEYLQHAGKMRQLALLRWVTSEILVDPELTSLEKSYVFLILKTIVDVLDENTEVPGDARRAS